MKRIERQAAAGKFPQTGTRTVCMALTIGAALVGSTCDMARAGTWRPYDTGTYSSVTTDANDSTPTKEVLVAKRTSPNNGQSSPTDVESRPSSRRFEWSPATRGETAQAATFKHTYSREVLAWSLDYRVVGVGIARIEASFGQETIVFFRDITNGKPYTENPVAGDGTEPQTTGAGFTGGVLTVYFPVAVTVSATAFIDAGATGSSEAQVQGRSTTKSIELQ